MATAESVREPVAPDAGLVKFHVSLESAPTRMEVLCLEFSSHLFLFVSEAPRICALIEAAPDDPVDLGTATTYSTTVVFGKDELSYHLLARRLVEVLHSKILVAVSSQTLPVELIRQVEAEVIRRCPRVVRPSQPVMQELANEMEPLSLSAAEDEVI